MHPSAIDQPNNQPEMTQLGPTEILSISESLFTTMLNMKFETDPQIPTEPWDDPLVGRITIDGDWDAEIRVIASDELAKVIACNMLGMTEDEIDEEDILDALGEVANIVGGNAKGNIDRECKLSLPSVGRADDFEAMKASSQTFACDGYRFEIQVGESA